MKIEVPEDLIIKTLDIYTNKGTRYLQNASIENVSGDEISMSCKLSIPETCFLSPPSIHLNSVDAMICFNQMTMVCLFAAIYHNICCFYKHVNIDIMNEHKRNVSITEFEKLKFRKRINNNNFYGNVQIQPLKSFKSLIIIGATFGFGNDTCSKDFNGTGKFLAPALLSNSR